MLLTRAGRMILSDVYMHPEPFRTVKAYREGCVCVLVLSVIERCIFKPHYDVDVVLFRLSCY